MEKGVHDLTKNDKEDKNSVQEERSANLAK